MPPLTRCLTKVSLQIEDVLALALDEDDDIDINAIMSLCKKGKCNIARIVNKERCYTVCIHSPCRKVYS